MEMYQMYLATVQFFLFAGTISNAQFIGNVHSPDLVFRSLEFMLPMRDGVKLHTRVVFPKEDPDAKRPIPKYTTIVDRSPYGYAGLEAIVDLYVPAGFVTIGQDMRGAQKSEGNFTFWHSDADDSQDLGDWIVQQPWSNGKVFALGISADGIGAFRMPENGPDWLLAQYVVWSSSIGYEVFYPNGAYLGTLMRKWIAGTFPDQKDELIAEFESNEMKNEWWDALDLTNKYDRVHAVSGFWAGWYDILLLGNLAAFNGYNSQSDPAVRGTSVLMIDPLGHCQDAAEFFPQDVIMGRSLLAVAQSYAVFGFRPVERPSIKSVTFYVMSSNDEAGLKAGQYWTSLDAFPAFTPTKFYLHSDGTASTTAPAPASSSSDSEEEMSTYSYDPKNPVPTMGGSNLNLPCGPLDQTEIDKRADVLVFETAVVEEELPLTGPLNAKLYVSSDVVDTDFMVRISDVYPTGEVRLIQDSAIRMRWREGGVEPVYMEKGSVYGVEMTLWNTSYVVAPGHALRFSVTSSNSPRFDVNLNNGVLMKDIDAEVDVVYVAQNSVYHSEKYASYVSLPVVSKEQLPEVHDIESEVKAMYPGVDFDAILKKYPDIGSRLAHPQDYKP